MAMTNAERQAAHKARRAETLEVLTQQNAALLEENAALRAELDALKEGPPRRSRSSQGSTEGRSGRNVAGGRCGCSVRPHSCTCCEKVKKAG